MIIEKTAPKWLDNPTATSCLVPSKEVREECGKATYSLQPNFPRMFEWINFASYISSNRQVLFSISKVVLRGSDDVVEPALQRIFDDINELSKEEDYDGYIFKPTSHARKSAKRLITEAYQRMEGRLPRPRVVPDGKGGIIMEWRNGADVVKLGCVASDTRRDYIYYKRENIYDAVEASVDDLIKWLDWLNHE
jgi:hypothetical protein